MKPSILVGVVILAAILSAGILAPEFRSAENKAADQAREEAALAARLLHRYDYRLEQLARQADPKNLKDADFDALIDISVSDPISREEHQVRDLLHEYNKKNSVLLNQMKRVAEKAGLPAPVVELPAVSAGGLKQALSRYEGDLKSNADLLKQAAQHAKSARTGNIVGAAQSYGVAEYTRAVALLAEARALRQKQQLLQARLLLLGGQWGAYQADEDYLAGLDVVDILAALHQDLDEVRQLHTEAASAATALATAVAGRTQELAEVEQELRQDREDLFALERQGFIAGDDESFQAYRDRYLELSNHLREREEREQYLRLGGRVNARFDGDNLETATVEGGDEVVGLEVLQPRLAAAEDKAARLANAVAVLEGHIDFVEQMGQAARDGQDRYTGLRDLLDTEQKETLPRVLDLAQEASEKEAEALKAAREAVSAYHSSQEATNKWVREAREIQSKKDTERKNPRLNMIAGDKYFPQIGSSAEAAALVLIGHIHAQRIEANQSLIDDMNIFVELRPGTEFLVADQFAEEITASREDALEKLTSAGEIYEKLISQAPVTTKWIAQAGQATVLHMLARIDQLGAEMYLASALGLAQEATQGREHSPYLQKHVMFRDHLRKQTAGGAMDSQPPTDEGDSPDDMFDDEEPADGDG